MTWATRSTHRRWLVIGPGGAGKSTLARHMGDILGLPVIHLDREFWKPGWVESDREAWAHRVEELCASPEWIMDGNYGGTLQIRLRAADAIVLLDPPPWQCLWGIYKRALFPDPSGRADMADGCPEQLPSRAFLWFVASYRWNGRKRALRKIHQGPKLPVFLLTSRGAVRRFLETLTPAT